MALGRLVLFCVLCCIPLVSSFLFEDADNLQNLLSLITEEKRMRSSLENAIQGLRNDIADMKSKHKSALCSCPPSGVVAFSATLTHDITNFGTSQPLVFDHVITNVGGAYDARHGHFRAPVSGNYKFSFSVLQGTASMWIGLELVRDGAVIGRIKTGDNGYWNMGTNIITAHLNTGDDVWVRHMSDTDNKRVVSGGGYFTMFTGHLIKAD